VCEHCQQFATAIKIALPTDLTATIDRLFFNGIKPGVLKILDGSLQCGDDMACLMECVYCKQQFSLICETYHGMGGEFGPTEITL